VKFFIAAQAASREGACAVAASKTIAAIIGAS
jgi:hypothetical protein